MYSSRVMDWEPLIEEVVFTFRVCNNNIAQADAANPDKPEKLNKMQQQIVLKSESEF